MRKSNVTTPKYDGPSSSISERTIQQLMDPELERIGMKGKQKIMNLDKARFTLDKVKKGYRSSDIARMIVDEYGVPLESAVQTVAHIKKQLYTEVESLRKEINDYMFSTLLSAIEECSELGDMKNKLKAMDLLARISKLYDNSPRATINLSNMGFKFGYDEQADDSRTETD